MELNHLKYFYYIARENGFSAASRVLRIAQPALTRTVKKLESDLGYPLFERRGKKIWLTKAGNDVYRKCEQIFAQVDEIRAIERTDALVSGPLNISAAEAAASHVVPAVLPALLRAHPGLYPTVTATSASDAIRLLIDGKVEFALLFHAPELVDSVEIRSTFPTRHRLVVATAKRRDPHVCSSFIGSREVDDVGNRIYPTLAKLRRIYPDAQIKVSTNSLTAHRQLALAGVGVAILPEMIVREDLKKKRLACLLADVDFVFQLKLITRRGEPLSPRGEAFVKFLGAAMG